MGEYAAALARLQDMGLMYPCFCTRAEIRAEIARAADAPQGPDGPIYPGTCRSLKTEERARRMNRGEGYALRLDMTRAHRHAGRLTWHDRGRGMVEARPERFGDIVLARKDLPAAYHLAVVVDDAFQNVTLVTRGEDLLSATHIQRLLQALLKLPEPAYAHHPLVLDESGKKFSKRDGAISLEALRDQGLTPADIRARIGL
jgi:glutamyl-Q tRNA(Asp) synthetase